MEELKLILDTISQTTGAAKQFGFLWLGLETMKAILAYLLAFSAFLLAYKLIDRIIKAFQDDNFASNLRAIVSPKDNYGPLTCNEKAIILSAVKRGISQNHEGELK
jgi:hypothetical protein